MAQIHHTTLVPSKVELLTAWLPRQRWFATTEGPPRLERRGGFRLDDPAGRVGIEILLVSDGTRTYQVPLTYRDAPLPGAEHALVGTTEHGVLGTRYVYDAAHDPVFVAQLLALLAGRVAAQAQHVSDTPEPRVVAQLVTEQPLALGASRVFDGEQSNTSIVCDVTDDDGAAAPGVVVKLFRVLAPGENPDAVVAAALTRLGSPRVPRVVGVVSGPVGGDDDGDLAVVQEYVADAEDASRAMVAAARAGADVAVPARAVGVTVARLHADLVAAFGTGPADDAARTAQLETAHGRLAAALEAAPDLHAQEGRIRDALAPLRDAPAPELQRIHGDLHLGQLLHRRRDEHWLVIDFEGEPLRPLAERVRPDLALRDVAGVLRSFDYAAATAARQGAEVPPDWTRAAREAFLAGYGEASGVDLVEAAPLLRALELDKALYEVTYEHRHRPGWISIPLGAIDVLLA